MRPGAALVAATVLALSSKSLHGASPALSAGSRDAAFWPFASDSPWNYPLGRNAKFAMPVAAGSPAAGRPNMSAGFGKMGINAGQYTIPVFVATSRDRQCNFSRSSPPKAPPVPPCKPGDELEGCQLYSAEVFARHIPADAVVSPGSDHHVTVVSPDHQTVIEGFGCSADGNGGFKCLGSAKNVDLAGNGWDSFGVWGGDNHPVESAGNGTMSLWRTSSDVALPRPNAALSNATQLRLGSDGFVLAAGTSALGGLIRSGELQNGIFHALQFVADPWRWNRNCPGSKLRSWGAYVWPASSSDDPTHDEFGTTGNLYEGGLLAIPPSVNISTLPLRTGKRIEAVCCRFAMLGATAGDAPVLAAVVGSPARAAALSLARAFQRYGMYGVDSGDVGGVSTATLTPQCSHRLEVVVLVSCDPVSFSQVQLRMEYTARAEMPALEGAFLADLATLARELR